MRKVYMRLVCALLSALTIDVLGMEGTLRVAATRSHGAAHKLRLIA